MVTISTLQEGITNVKDLIGDTISNITNPFTSTPKTASIAGGITGAVLGAGTAVAVSAVSKRRKKRKSKSKSFRKRDLKSNRKRRRKSKRGYKYAYTARKGKDTSTRRIRQTKNGQPYIILANGRARFIKRSSARRSRKLKGGRY